MPDAALSVSSSSSSIAGLLSGTSPDSSPQTNPTAQGSDPFAALLAGASHAKATANPGKTKMADAVAALLAPKAPTAATTVTAAAAAAAAATPELPIDPDTLPVDSDAALTAPKGKSADSDDDSDDKDDGTDALADAIASGATAVLALAPTIVASPLPQAMIRKPVGTDAPFSTRPPKLIPVAGTPAMPRLKTTAAGVDAQADQAATQALGADAMQADAPGSQQRPPATDAKPATTQLPPDIAKAVAATLDQGDDGSATAVAASPTTVPAALAAAKLQMEQQAQQPAAQQAQLQAAPALPPAQTARRRSDEVAAPRRTDDTRKRTDAAPTDAASAALTQGTTGDVHATAPAIGTIQSKGDTVIEQTLSIARDGAWLDKLAQDIASAGDGGNLQFKLDPQNLGSLSVAISQGANGASIRLTADNDATRNILVDAQPKLIAEARAQGLKISDTQVDVRQDQNHSQNQNSNQDAQRWAQNGSGQNGTSQNGQNRQSSPSHQPFVSNLARKTEDDSESPDRDSNALYA